VTLILRLPRNAVNRYFILEFSDVFLD
jgi:hypothetical protein